MPEEEKTELENNGKLVKEIYIDRELVDKFWIEDSKSYYGKPEKGMLGTLIFNDCGDDRVILLMGSDCGTEDLMMEGEVFSEASDGISFDYEAITRPMVLSKRFTGDDFDAKLLGGKDHQEVNKFFKGVNKEAEVTNSMAESTIGDSKSQEDSKLHDPESENMLSFAREAQDSINSIQQFSGTLSYSGSVSLRSTSSTASTQSFAFPITVIKDAGGCIENLITLLAMMMTVQQLAQEWNSSPVRMAKPDKRQLRKQNSWKMRMSCFCCRF